MNLSELLPVIAFMLVVALLFYSMGVRDANRRWANAAKYDFPRKWRGVDFKVQYRDPDQVIDAILEGYDDDSE